jgi:multicomponent K+:H+ antiporter subunit G
MNAPISPLLDAVIAGLLLVGGTFALIGAYGLAKLGDFLKRLHGPTKVTTLGIGSILIASMLWFGLRGGVPIAHELLITLFVFITAPVGAHMMVKGAMAIDQRTRPPPPPPAPTDPAA